MYRGSSGLDGDCPQAGQSCPAHERQTSGQEEGSDLLGVERKFLAAGLEGRGEGQRTIGDPDLPAETAAILGGGDHSDRCRSFSRSPS